MDDKSASTEGKMKKTARLWNCAGFEMVAWGGIEPPTQGFSILCSTD
jgi:hypothetical protein